MMRINVDGSVEYSTRFRGLPCEQWYVKWIDFPESCVTGPHDWPLLCCPSRPELGLYEMHPTTDFVVKVTVQ